MVAITTYLCYNIATQMTNLRYQNRNFCRKSVASTITSRRNTIKDMNDTESLIKDIKERDDIIQNYRITRSLDRDNAIRKIMELRKTDDDIWRVARIQTALSPMSPYQATNDQIVNELIIQNAVLRAKLIVK